jgi:hypothetical protein
MPSITFWTRLEPFTRLDDIDAGLAARIHDPLWLLARQWQTGEFQAEDAGTPVRADARMERATISRYHPGPVAAREAVRGRPYSGDEPLEALVEHEGLPRAADPRRDLRLAAETGAMFLRMLERAGAGAGVRAAFAGEPEFAIAVPAGDAPPDDAGRRYLAITAGRLPDGVRLYEALVRSLRPAGAGAPSLPSRPVIAAAERPKAIAAGEAYLAWFETRWGPPGDAANPAWVPERMEYAFAVGAKGAEGSELVLSAPEHHGGRLDWYAFDAESGVTLGTAPSDPPPNVVTQALMPTPIRYPGMAADRWWEFEDARVNLNRVEGDPDELLRLQLVEFALLYANDWYVMPFDATPGSVYRLRSLVVTDAFGQHTLVPHHGKTPGQADWRMYTISPSDDLLFLPPVLASSLHGEPVEEVVLARDELSNIVWGVERLTPGVAGGTIDREAEHRHRDTATPSDDGVPPADDELRYRLATPVAAHWIPFKPKRIDPAKPDIRFQRAAALLDDCGRPALSRPLGRILEPDRPDLSLFEEEVPGEGIRVVREYQYARWIDGGTALWLARRKGPGAPQPGSGLRFDHVTEA